MCRRFAGRRALQVIAWLLVIVLLWLYGHVWVASLIMFTEAVFPKPWSVEVAVGSLCVLWLVGGALVVALTTAPERGR